MKRERGKGGVKKEKKKRKEKKRKKKNMRKPEESVNCPCSEEAEK